MVNILADSTCDLSPELIEKYGIHILPLHVLLGDRDCRDGADITPDELYVWSDATKETPKTSAPSIDEAMEALEKATDGDQTAEIICFSISSEMSATGNVMQMAVRKLGWEDRVFVVDSRNLSTGIGLLVLEAAVKAREGWSAEEIVGHIVPLTHQVRASFVVDTMVYLHRGGRCGSVAAIMGTTFRIHPEIVVEDGKMHAAKKYRGLMSQVYVKYAKDLEEQLLNAYDDRVFITHSGCREEDIAAVKAYLESLDHFKEILITRAGGVISSHCGPGTLGVLFIEKEK